MSQLRLYLDIEVYINYFLIGFMNEAGKVVWFEMYDGKPLDVEGVTRVLTSGAEIITFNGLNYDIPLTLYALNGATCEELKAASDEIIGKSMKGWQFEKAYPIASMTINHVDLMEVAPGKISLKLYSGRLHCPRMQDLPIEHDAVITPEQRPIIRWYNRNDLRNTQALKVDLTEQLELRRVMSAELRHELEEAGLVDLMRPEDLRSKSDAQIAEVVLKQRVFISTGAIPRKRPLTYSNFTYKPPAHIQFKSPELNEALRLISSAEMKIDSETGHVQMPPTIKKLALTIGGTTYKLGIGGIHSQESEVTHVADEEHYLRDIDVVSYYPSLILNMGMYPLTMGPAFLHQYRAILTERIAAKRAGEKVKADSLKITLNGTFGKTSSKYSVLYNPSQMIATTLTGQLSLLMLIEAFERFGIPVVSANTDGVVVRCRRDREEHQRKIVKVWEKVTNLETEETNYRSLHSRDVNSYIAVKLDGKVKTKGFFAKATIAKNPQNEVCLDAVIEYLTKGTPVEETIRACQDIRKFVTVRRVTGGAIKDGVLLGKAIRWYYSTDVSGTINNAKNNNTIPRSVGARPAMDLPETLPHDIDYEWYITEAHELLMDLAVIPRPPKAKLPRRNTKEWKTLEAEGLVEVDDYDKPQWAVHYDLVPNKYKEVS